MPVTKIWTKPLTMVHACSFSVHTGPTAADASWGSSSQQLAKKLREDSIRVVYALKPHLVHRILPDSSSRAAARLVSRTISRVAFHDTVLTTLGYPTTAEICDELFDEWSSAAHAAVDWEEVRRRIQLLEQARFVTQNVRLSRARAHYITRRWHRFAL